LQYTSVIIKTAFHTFRYTGVWTFSKGIDIIRILQSILISESELLTVLFNQ